MQVTMFFSDIVGFTSLSAALPADAVCCSFVLGNMRMFIIAWMQVWSYSIANICSETQAPPILSCTAPALYIQLKAQNLL